MSDPFLKIGPRVTAFPVVHASGDFAWEVRRFMSEQNFDCLAVPLPQSFQSDTETAILDFPVPGIVVQKEFDANREPWSQDEYESDDPLGASYVPIDPCQPVIAALRTAMGERIPRHFIDQETSHFESYSRSLPDAYALKQVECRKFAAAIVPHLTAPDSDQWRGRIAFMARRLQELSVDYKNILFVVSILDWPWIRQAFNESKLDAPADEPVQDPIRYQVDPNSYYFLLGELPFITNLYERARATLDEDEHLSIDGVKELLLSARSAYRAEYQNRARKITPRTLATCVKYIRNLTLVEHCFSPQLISIVTAAKQIVGDGFALSVLAQAKQYEYAVSLGVDEIKMGIGEASFPDGDVLPMVNRLPGPPLMWSELQLTPKPDESRQLEWAQKWNPHTQCSWPPEDVLIENFRQAVFDRALESMGADLAKTEKFTSSVKDGIDIRDTIRHWYEGDIYVKVLPPHQGKLDCAVMLFDSPADPRAYPWRTTWFAEHKEESTLCFYATNFMDEPIGPGICLATYGGAMFLYPPKAIPDIWVDPRLDFATTLEERLLAAACLHSSCPNIALLSSAPPGIAWKQLAKRYRKNWVHLPLSRFSDSTVQQLRMVHVLNGKEIRSIASEFIRRV